MCVWCVVRKTARLHRIVQGDRCEPYQGESHRKIVTTQGAKRNSEAGMNDGSPQLVHIQAGRMWYAIL
jgi:hypothetical protein